MKMTFPTRSWLFLILLIVGPSCANNAYRPTKRWTALYVFGDSYSDSGAGYVDCDGPTAVVYLARELDIPFTYANDPNRSGKSLNFAVSGASSGSSEGVHMACLKRGVGEKTLGRGMATQVQDFVQRVKSGEITFPAETTLFFVAGGLNDKPLPSNTTVANLKKEITAIYSVGGRHFYVAMLPTCVPEFKEVAERLNPFLREIPSSVHLVGADVRLGRWGEFYDDVMEKAQGYGLKNTVDACAGRALFDQDPTPAGSPSTYYFYHAGHPSTFVHRIVGEDLAREVALQE